MYLVFICMPGESYRQTETVGWGFHHFICILKVLYDNVPLVECMYLVFTRMPGEHCRRRLRSCFCTGVTYFER